MGSANGIPDIAREADAPITRLAVECGANMSGCKGGIEGTAANAAAIEGGGAPLRQLVVREGVDGGCVRGYVRIGTEAADVQVLAVCFCEASSTSPRAAGGIAFGGLQIADSVKAVDEVSFACERAEIGVMRRE